MEWYLLKSVYGDITDDVSFEGMVLLTKEELEDGRKWCETNPDYKMSVGMGNTLEIEVTAADVLSEIQTAVKISNEEYRVIERYLGEVFGDTTRFMLLKNECFRKENKNEGI